MTDPIATPTNAGPRGASEGSVPAEGIFTHWPNRITAMRFVGAVLLFACLAWIESSLNHELEGGGVSRWIWNLALWLFVAIAATDWLDGWIARRTGTVTAFGRIADPFVDKILVLGSFVFLVALPQGQRFLPTWVVVAVLARELLVTGIRGYVESLGLEFPADRWGKLKMILQCVAIGVMLGIPAIPWPGILETLLVLVAHALVWLTLVMTLGSGVGYAVKCRRLLSGAEHQA